jgi:hypothetical protein
MRHGRRDATGQRFHKGKAGGNAFTLTGDEGLTLHGVGSPCLTRPGATARRRRSAIPQRRYHAKSEAKA